MLLQSTVFLLVSSWIQLVLAGSVQKTGNVCTIIPSTNGADDSAAIIQAFQQCKANSRVVFLNQTYHIEKEMLTTGLTNVTVEQRGYLLMSNTSDMI
jgi:hypothetical protein